MVNVRKVSGPTPEPISLADARLYLRQDVPGYSGDTSQDPLVRSFISAARRVCEMEMDVVIGPQEFVEQANEPVDDDSLGGTDEAEDLDTDA